MGDPRAEVAARRIKRFAARHRARDAASGAGGEVRGSIQHLGQDQWRLVLLAPDGTYGDFVVEGQGLARQALELAGAVEADPTDRDFTGGITTGPYEWQRMAGSQLHP